MPTPDELLPLVTNILDRIEEDRSALEGWRQTEDGQKVIQYVVQIGKYNTNLGEGKDISISDRLDRALLEEVRDLLRSQLSSQAVDINWQQVSRLLLEQQVQRLTSNPLTHAEGIAYCTDQVYVPLGLVERKRQSRRGEDVSPEEGSRLYEETEITRQFEHEEFLEQVLGRGDSPRSGGRRLAIIGEPGAGKTTLLQQMARWISQTIDDSIVIWISLADLQGEPLENYLLGPWLQAAVQQQGKAEASSQIKDAFVAQFQQGRVLLLLDGVDEMQVSSGNSLSEIERQVRGGGLLSQAQIVLTCRLNLWDGNRNALDMFDTYRTLEFSYPQQVEQFIGQWFGALPEEQAERLCEALKTTGKERIRDLVKNPLRLTLLCFNWHLGEGTLPETKAALYEQFVADFYEWKRERFPTTAEQRRQLNAALGELAREAIDKEKTRFRLRHDFVCKFLGEPDEPDSLFQMALQLGWLNQIGVDTENRRKAVYAFFHPTFQEYFAAKQFYDQSDYDALAGHVGEKYWSEIIRIFLSMLLDAKDFIFLLKKYTDKLLAEDQALQKYLGWAHNKALTVSNQHDNLFDDLCSSASTRSIYLTSTLKFALLIDPIFCQGEDYPVLIPLGILFDLNLCKVMEYASIGNFKSAHGLCKWLVNLFDEEQEAAKELNYNPRIAEKELEEALAKLTKSLGESLVDFNYDGNRWTQFMDTKEWLRQFQDSLRDYRDINHNWDFNDGQKALLSKYYDANGFLISYFKSDIVLNKEFKRDIENSMFLPTTQVLQ